MDPQIKKLRSQEMTDGIINAGNRILLYATGIGKEEMEKPFIGIVNSWNEMHPGHKHLRELSAAVKEGVLAAGGQPFEFNTIALCDGETQGHKGMCFVLPSRDLIADSVEVMAEGQRLGGPIALVKDGDIIHIDLYQKSLTIDVSDEEMAQRRKAWTPHPPMVNGYYLDRYARLVGPTWEGAVLE